MNNDIESNMESYSNNDLDEKMKIKNTDYIVLFISMIFLIIFSIGYINMKINRKNSVKEVAFNGLVKSKIDMKKIDIDSKSKRSNFAHIDGGTFQMGSSDQEEGRHDDELQHLVKVDDFWMSKYEVSIFEYNCFLSETGYKYNGSSFFRYKGNYNKGKYPVTNVSWYDANEYCKWLQIKLNKVSKKIKEVRLPTEAEWEYACRAGTTTAFNNGSNKLKRSQANYYLYYLVKVDSYDPNEFGLYNMHGNVWEWCNDWYDEKYYNECEKKYVNESIENPKGPKNGEYRVLRGGGWSNYPVRCRSASRSNLMPSYRSGVVGFRVVFLQ